MPVAPSFQDLLDQGIAEAQARRPDLLFADGDVTTALAHGSAAMSDVALRFGVQAFRDTFIDGASGDALTARVNDRCNIQRHPATRATVIAKFARNPGGGSGTIPAGTRVGTDFDASGKQVVFTTNVDVIVGAGAVGFFDVTCTAVDAGVAGNISTYSLVKILDPLFDSSFLVTNATNSGAGGNEEESDEALRERARNFFTTLRRGTLAALEEGALLVPSVRIAKASEDPDTFAVTLKVSDANGNSNLQMVSDVKAEIEKWRCAGVLVTVVGGRASALDLTLTLSRVRSGFDVAANAGTIADAVEARVNRLKVGETAYLDMIIAAAIAAFQDDIFDVTFSAISLGGVAQATNLDVTPASDVIIRAGTITVQAG